MVVGENKLRWGGKSQRMGVVKARTPKGKTSGGGGGARGSGAPHPPRAEPADPYYMGTGDPPKPIQPKQTPGRIGKRPMGIITPRNPAGAQQGDAATACTAAALAPPHEIPERATVRPNYVNGTNVARC